VILPVVFTPVPAATHVISTENVHEAAGAKEAPDSEMVPVPAAASTIPPGHDPLTPFGVATTIPAGSVSEKTMPLSEEDELVLVIVKESVAEEPAYIYGIPPTLAAKLLKASDISGGDTGLEDLNVPTTNPQLWESAVLLILAVIPVWI
jgi:hypothetical protein